MATGISPGLTSMTPADWFAGDAAAADNSKAEHRIYASSFKRTGISFPLVWDLSIDWVPAVNVTERYTGAAKSPEGKVRLLVRVLDKPEGRRVAARVTVTDAADASVSYTGTSSSETADLNNILPFQLFPGHTYHLEIRDHEKSVNKDIAVAKESEQIITIPLAP